MQLGKCIMAGHLATLGGIFPGSEELTAQLVNGETPQQRGPQFTITGDDPVVILQGRGTTDDGSLLANRGHIESDPPLALERDHALINPPIENHQTIQLNQALGIEVGQIRFVLDPAFWVENLDELSSHTLNYIPASVTRAT